MAYCRRATHSGSWYSSDPQRLNSELEGYLAAAEGFEQSAVRAVIAPHAGFRYSGPTAAYAYKSLNLEGRTRVFVLGPSHHVHLRKCYISGASLCQTPLGDLTVDECIRTQLLETGQFDITPSKVDEDEHSIEMHLPYIAKVIDGKPVTIVPIMVGQLGRSIGACARVLAPYLDDPQNLFVVSSDFCHWGARFDYQPYDSDKGSPSEFIAWLDQQGMSLIESQNPEAFSEYLESTHNTICGRNPILLLLHTMREARTTFRTRFVRYEQSSAAGSMQDSSVSYASALIEAV